MICLYNTYFYSKDFLCLITEVLHISFVGQAGVVLSDMEPVAVHVHRNSRTTNGADGSRAWKLEACSGLNLLARRISRIVVEGLFLFPLLSAGAGDSRRQRQPNILQKLLR